MCDFHDVYCLCTFRNRPAAAAAAGISRRSQCFKQIWKVGKVDKVGKVGMEGKVGKVGRVGKVGKVGKEGKEGRLRE